MGKQWGQFIRANLNGVKERTKQWMLYSFTLCLSNTRGMAPIRSFKVFRFWAYDWYSSTAASFLSEYLWKGLLQSDKE